MSTGGSMVWRRPTNETYDERKERIFKNAAVTQDT